MQRNIDMKAFATVLMLALAASWMPTEAHASDQLLVFGRILQEGKKSEGATAIIYNGNAVYRTVTTTKSGKYAIKLPFGFYFTMEVKKEGYITKRVVFDTRIDAQIDLLDDYVCDVDLLDLEWFGGMDIGNLDFPMAIIVYQGNGSFDYTEDYAIFMREEYETALTKAMNSTTAQPSHR